jgi:hypothetical protein
MLAKSNIKLLTALSSLEGDANFELIKAWLTQSIDDLNVANASTKDEVLTRWNQGSIQALMEILETSNHARQALSRLK